MSENKSAVVLSDATEVALTEDTAALVKALYSGTGPVSETETAALVLALTSGDVTVNTADAAVKSADTAVSSAREALVAARAESTRIRAAAGEARVTFGRVALALTTKDVRGTATMTGAAFAEATGVSGAYVSQVVSVARAARRLGTTSPSAWADLSAARKIGAGALQNVVSSALDTATKRTLETATEGKATPVRATVSEIGAAREIVAGSAPTVPNAPTTAPRLSAIRSTLDKINTAVGSQMVDGTEDDRTRVLAILDTLRATIVNATLSA